MWIDCTKIALGEKNISKEKIRRQLFCFLYVKVATVQILRQTNKFRLSFSSLK